MTPKPKINQVPNSYYENLSGHYEIDVSELSLEANLSGEKTSIFRALVREKGV